MFEPCAEGQLLTAVVPLYKNALQELLQLLKPTLAESVPSLQPTTVLAV